MKLLIDTDICKRDKEDFDTVLYLLSFLADAPITVDTFEKARQKGYLKFEQPYDRNRPFPSTVTLSNTGEYVTDTLLAGSKTAGDSEDRYINLANKLRGLFPAGKKSGYAYTWRDSPSCIADRLRKFTAKYGDYSDEDIVAATKKYVDSFNGDYKYMQLLKYFIWKNKTTGEEIVRGRIVGEVERQSQLAAWLEDNEEEMVVNHDWDVTLK